MQNKIHIFNGFQNPNGGSEQETLSLTHLLGGKSEVQLWSSSSRSSPEFTQKFGIGYLGVAPRQRPDGGTYVFVGAHWHNRVWPYFAQAPERLIYVFNTFHPKILALTSKHPPLLRWPKTEYVLLSEFQKKLLGVDGVVHPSPIDIDLFKPVPRAANERLVIGRLSRDTRDKHHEEDVALYRDWSAGPVDIKLQGATCLRDALGNNEHIELLSEGTTPAVDFLRSLDIFYYRTGAHIETFGRVVIEAMACGLPVVCHRRGGYVDSIRHGENGFLFDTTDEARELVGALLADPALRAAVGQRARQTVESMYSKEASESRAEFYRQARAAS